MPDNQACFGFRYNPSAVNLWKQLWRWESNQEGKFPPKPYWCSVVWSFHLLTSTEKNFKNARTNSLNLLLVGTLFFLLLLLLLFFFFSGNFLDKKFTQLFSLQFRMVAKYELNCFPALYLITLNDYGSSEKWNSVIQREN